jgi:hypothetical protein
MSEDAEIHAERLKRATDLRHRFVLGGDQINASEGDPLGAANEGLFASNIPVVGSSCFSRVLCGVSLLIVLALVIYGVVVKGHGTRTSAADAERLVCRVMRLQERLPNQDYIANLCFE